MFHLLVIHFIYLFYLHYLYCSFSFFLFYFFCTINSKIHSGFPVKIPISFRILYSSWTKMKIDIVYHLCKNKMETRNFCEKRVWNAFSVNSRAHVVKIHDLISLAKPTLHSKCIQAAFAQMLQYRDIPQGQPHANSHHSWVLCLKFGSRQLLSWPEVLSSLHKLLKVKKIHTSFYLTFSF